MWKNIADSYLLNLSGLPEVYHRDNFANNALNKLRSFTSGLTQWFAPSGDHDQAALRAIPLRGEHAADHKPPMLEKPLQAYSRPFKASRSKGHPLKGRAWSRP
jgi:hypothetical protein